MQLRHRHGRAASNTPKNPSSSFDEVVLGRRLQNGTCSCDPSAGAEAPPETTVVRLLAVGGDGHYLDFVPERFRSRAPAFTARTGGRVQVEVIGLGDLDTLHEEILHDATAKVYDGYIFLPVLTGTLVERDGLADLTEFVAENEDVAWTDIFPFNRDVQSVYDGSVRLIPCDGDVHSLFYRKDLFQKFNRTAPRTWDEYSDTAAFFHGMEVEVPGTNETVKLSGSCVERKINCHEPLYFNMLIHSTSTQAKGTNTGSLLDPDTFEPLMGEALAETLRHLENQVRYGAEDELVGESCSGLNIERINAGTCAMTFFWGDIFARGYGPGSVLGLGDNLGIAPTPGVTKVLDRSTGKLVQCTEELCPYGETYPDIGRVNRAPYAAAGGWSAGVSAGVSTERQQAMAGFLGYACGKEQSVDDVIPFAQGELFTGTDPYRRSHFDVDTWVQRGYPKNTTEEYQQTIQTQLSSLNTVLDVRFPDASRFLNAMHQRIHKHLVESTSTPKSQADRMAVAEALTQEWREITIDYDIKRPGGGLPLKSIYQKSLNVYTPPNTDDNDGLSIGAIVGIVVGCSLFVAVVTGLLACWFVRRERSRQHRQWVLRRENLRMTNEVLGEGAFGVIVKGYIRGTPVAVKTSHHTMTRLDSTAADSSDFADASTKTSSSKALSATQLREDLSALIKLRSPHVVQFIGAMIEKKTVFIAMEYMEHGSLQGVLSGDSPGTTMADGKIRVFELQWAIQIARGLDYLHNVPPPLGPILHTDLRASNVLLDSSFNAKISNFSLEARVVGSTRDQGHLLWMAPEVINGAAHTLESDIYSFGMVLYEIASRSRPFRVHPTAFTEYTVSTLTEVSDDTPSLPAIDGAKTLGGTEDEFVGEDNGEKVGVPELISRISNLTLVPPCRPRLPESSPLFIRDICLECWNKNPSRRPSMGEIVERIAGEVSPSSLTKQLVQRSSILDSILPQDVQEKLARNEPIPPKSYSNVTVIFSDIVGFTATSSKLTAEEVGDLIRRLFTKYDEVAARYGVKKLDVIGDAFLGVAGIPNEEPDHALRAAAFALDAIEVASKTPVSLTNPSLGTISIRFGLATGPVVATVIGSAMHPKYTLFGTTVNTASRMESSSEANRVQCTAETAKLIREQGPPDMGVHYRKKMDIKGRGEMDTYFLTAPPSGFDKLLRKRRRMRNSTRKSTLTSPTSSSFGLADQSIPEDPGEDNTASEEHDGTNETDANLTTTL